MSPESLTLSPAARGARPSRLLPVALWVAQGLLATLFLAAGLTHAAAPLEVAAARAPWVASLPPALVRGIGVAELAGALGVLLPAATRVRPGLTPLAAAGLALVMALAVPFHLARGEGGPAAGNVAIGSLCAFVAWGRARRAPIAARRRPA